MTHNILPKRISILVIVSALFLASCVKYHTRMFVFAEKRIELSDYIITPSIRAYEGVYEKVRKLDTVMMFDVELMIRINDSTISEKELRHMREHQQQKSARRDSVIIAQIYSEWTITNALVLLTEDSAGATDSVVDTIHTIVKFTKSSGGFGYPVVWYYFESIVIPLQAQKLVMVVPYVSESRGDDTALMDTLRFPMRRRESHNMGLWVGD